MKPVTFHPAAEDEMVAAAKYYEAQQAELGKRFLASVQDAINRIMFNALLFPVIEGDVRRCLTRTFPFGVLFRIQPHQIAIVAIMHTHRNPHYWQGRQRLG